MAAEYGIDLLLTIKNSNKLKQLNKDFKKTNEEQQRVRQGLREMDKGYKKFFPSLNKIVGLQTKAQEMFNKTALGTRANTMAAKDLVAAQRLLNAELQERNRLLKEVRTGGFESNIVQNVGRSRTSRAGSGFAKFSARADIVTDQAKKDDMKARFRQEYLKRIDKQVAKIALIQTQQQSQRAFAGLAPQKFGVIGGQIGPALPRGFRVRQQFKEGGLFGMPGGMRSRIKGGVGSALIGGGFPALFGAGGLSSVMGGLAGGIGGALAPGGGFAASIAATAIAAQIQKAEEFDNAIKNLNKSIAATGSQSKFTAGQIKEFGKSMRMTKEEALEALKAFQQFGAAARISLLKVFGDEATFNMLASLKDNAAILSKMDQITKNLGFEQAGLVLEILNTQGARAAENKILELTVKKNKELNMQIKERVGAEGRLRKIRKEQRAEEELKVQQDINNAKTILELQIRRTEELRKQAIIKAPTDEIKKLLDPLYQVDALSKSIGDSFSESFRGIVRGSMTAEESLRNLFQRTADHFADMASQILANQIRAGILGLFQNFMGLGPLGNPLSRATNTSVAATGIPSNPVGFSGYSRPNTNTVLTSRGTRFRADGGPVKGGGSYIVGERGPELFTPGRSGMITSNENLGSTTVIVNVDASGSSVEGDQQGANVFGEQLAAAVQAVIINEKRVGGLLS